MLSSQRLMIVKQKIVNYHGRVDKVTLTNKDPTPFIEEAKRKE